MKSLMKWFRKPSALGRTPARRPESFRPQLEALGGAAGPGRPAARRPCSARPEVEVLEAREVPAQLSGASFYQFGGQWDLAVAAINATNHHAVVYDWDRGSLDLGGNAKAVSMGPDGKVFVLNSDGTLTGFYSGSVTPHALNGWSSEISAGQGPGVRVFAIGTGGVGYVNVIGGSQSTWVPLGDPQGLTLSHISAGLDGNGNDVVFAIASDGHIYEHDANWDPNNSRWSLVDGSAKFTQLSATPHDEVFAIDQSGTLHQASLRSYWGLFSYWQDVALTAPSGKPLTALSAAAFGSQADEVYVIDTNKDAFVYHTNSGWNTQRVDYGVSEIAAVGGNNYYDVYNGSLYYEYGNYWEYNHYYGGPVL